MTFVWFLAALVSADPAPAPATVRVQVTAVEPSGAVVVGGAAEVRLERTRMPKPDAMDDTPELVQAWTATASPDGAARFADVPPRSSTERDAVVVTWQGIATRADLIAPNDGTGEPKNVVVRRPTRDVRALTMVVRLEMAPRDSGIEVTHDFQLDNPTHAVIDTDQGPGLVLPLVAPAPFGEPTDSFLPQRPEPREFITQQAPDDGRVLVEKGRLVFRGPVTPEGVRVRVVYMIPYAGETTHTYGVRMPVPASSFSLLVKSAERVVPAITFRAPSDVFVRGALGGQERSALLREPPGAGQVVLIDVVGTPDRHVLMRPLGAGLGMIVVGVLLVLALGKKRRA